MASSVDTKKSIGALNGLINGAVGIMLAPKKYSLMVAERSAVFGIKCNQQVLMHFDKPHNWFNFPHININKKFTGVKDPHYPISDTALSGFQFCGKLAEYSSMVITLVATASNVKRVYDANKEGKEVIKEVISIGKEITGGCVGSVVGAKMGAIVLVILGPVGSAIGGLVGGIIGGFVGESFVSRNKCEE